MQGLANWGARRGGLLGGLALNGGAALNAGFEALGINAAASAGDQIGSGDVGRGTLAAAFVVGGGVLGRGLNKATVGFAGLFAKAGGLSDETIVGIRSLLRENGFVMKLSQNKRGYLFTNAEGEEVRIMRGESGWYLRAKNSEGNYLDRLGNPGTKATSHIEIRNR